MRAVTAQKPQAVYDRLYRVVGKMESEDRKNRIPQRHWEASEYKVKQKTSELFREEREYSRERDKKNTQEQQNQAKTHIYERDFLLQQRTRDTHKKEIRTECLPRDPPSGAPGTPRSRPAATDPKPTSWFCF